MSPSLRALLAGIIDYAGLFPPANLPLDQAVRNYARYRTEPESWMLARFVCPAKRLAELNARRDDWPAALNLSVLGSDVDRSQTAVSALLNECYALRLYRGPERQVHVDAVELRLPASLFQKDAIREAIRQASLQATGDPSVAEVPHESVLAEVVRAAAEQVEKALEQQRLPLVSIFFEVENPPEWHATIKSLTSILSTDPLRRQGLKVRCGGLNAAAFPPPEDVAFAVCACRDTRVPLKFTAGLHHPIRRFDAGVQTKMHGFLNVFGAGVLAHARNLTEEQVTDVIADEDARNFVFEDHGFRWKDWRASVEEIAAARRELVTSYGSCSFDEPRADLRALGLLP